jgi:2-polyprenyl-6-methoxyphenol hydroxylase-like FAD-dependent oxidoreductase
VGERHAIVVGSGITGLARALVLAQRGARVTVLDRDPAPDARSPSAAFATWERRGVAQIRHSHAFLGRLRNLLRERHPDVLDALLAAGVREYRMTEVPPPTLDGLIRPEPGDDELVALGCRRTTFEWVLRELVARRRGVALVADARVDGLLATPGRVPRVRGVRVTTPQGAQELAADLVVDAGGRRSRCVAWLAAIGAAPPEETSEPSGINYYTRFYRLRAGADEPGRGEHPTAADWGWIKYGLFPADDRTFSVTLAAPLAIPRLKVLAQPAAFDAMARLVPGLVPWLDVAEPVDDLDHPVQAMGRLVNRMRRFVGPDGPSTEGFLVLGDAAYCTNPLYGRGCAQGFLHAELMGDALDMHGWDLLGAVAVALDRKARAQIEPFFRASVLADRDAVRKAEGRAPSTLAGRLRERFYDDGVVPATRCDPVVFRAFLRMMNMLETPEEAFGRPEVALRALWVALRPRRWNAPYLPPPPPDRDATLASLEAAAHAA